MTLKCAKAPCKSCPYRKDVPSGVWAAHEYDKLPAYDAPTHEQLTNGAMARFDCHQRDGHLCAGWVACHGGHNLLSLRLIADRIDDSVWDYESPVPVFKSGTAAARHGKRAINRPAKRARSMVQRLSAKRDREGWQQ